MTLKTIMTAPEPQSSLDPITTSESNSIQNQSNQIPPDHKFITIFCDNCGHSHKIPLFCKDKTCIYCRKRLYGHTIQRYREIMTGNKQLRFMTLTIVNRDILHRSDIDQIRSYWKKLYNLKAIKSRIKGGLYVIEVTNTGKGWHIHLHIIMEGEYIPQSYLSHQWKRITGDSRIVYISSVKNHFACFRYISGYLLKTPVVGKDGQLLSYVLSSVRVINSFGTWYRIKRKKGVFICEKCGNRNWISAYTLEHGFGVSEWMDSSSTHDPPKATDEPYDLQTWLILDPPKGEEVITNARV